MKQIFTIFATLLILASCTRPGKQPAEKKELSFAQLVKHIGDSNAFKVFDGYGLTEEDATARGNRKVKQNATVTAWFNDIVLSGSPASLTYTTSKYAEWGGVTNFPESMATDGAYAVWSCNRYFDNLLPPPTVTCSDAPQTGIRNYQAFTADHTRTDSTGIHISNVLTVNN